MRFAILGGTALALAVGFRGADALARSAAERWANWSVATDIGLAHPLGVGLGRLSAAYLEARPPDANVTRYAHSTLFQAFGEAGWPGVVLVLVVLAGFARLAVLLRSWRMTHGSLPTREALVAGGTFALLARAFVDYDLQIGRSAALIGAAAALALGAAEGEGAKAPKVADGPVALGRRVLAGAVVVALLVVAFFVGEHHRAVAPFEVGEDPPDYESVVHLVDYAARRPGDVDAQVIATRLRLGELQRCRTDCEALEASMAAFIDDQLRRPHPSPDVVLAGASLAHYRGDVEEALRLVRDALARDPSSLRAHTLRLSVAWTHDHPELAPALELARRYLTPAQLEEAYDRAGLPPD